MTSLIKTRRHWLAERSTIGSNLRKAATGFHWLTSSLLPAHSLAKVVTSTAPYEGRFHQWSANSDGGPPAGSEDVLC